MWWENILGDLTQLEKVTKKWTYEAYHNGDQRMISSTFLAIESWPPKILLQLVPDKSRYIHIKSGEKPYGSLLKMQ